MKKNLQIPQKSLSFRNLFRFFWREGVGFELGSDGIGQRWNYENFSIAMQRFGKGVGDSTVEAWYAGTQVPLNNNMNALARVAGDGKPKFVSPWRVELNLGIIRQEEAKEVLARRAEVLIPQPDPVLKPYVSDLRICGEDCFNDMTSTCTTNLTHFAKGTKLIYVSFQLNDMPTGKMFQRKWYRNGEKFKELTDFYDGAWPGYTFLYNRRGHDVGEYAIRIYIDGEPVVGQFVVG